MKETNIGDKIRQRRIDKGLSQEKLAEDANLSLRTVQRIERGETNPRGHSLNALGQALGIEIESLAKAEVIIPADETTPLRLINLSALTIIFLPLLNIIFPLLIWRKHQTNALANQYGRNIINFQISWFIVTSILLLLAPFIQLIFIPAAQASTSFPILITYITLWAFNIFKTIRTAQQISAERWESIYPRVIKFL